MIIFLNPDRYYFGLVYCRTLRGHLLWAGHKSDAILMDFFYVLLLSMAVSVDALAAGVAYGTKGIHMPIGSLGMVGVVTIVCVAIAMGGAHLLGGFIDAHVATVMGALVLVMLGVYRFLLDFLTTTNLPATKNNDDIPSHDPGNQAAARKSTFAVGDLVIKHHGKVRSSRY